MVNIGGRLHAQASYTYDPAGNLTSITDPLGRVSKFNYDSGNRQVDTFLPANSSAAWEHVTYDFAGRNASRTDASGAATSYTYDSVGRLTRIQPPVTRPGSEVSFTYDKRGLRKSMTDALGSTYYSHDFRGRISQEITPYAGTLNYSYDGLGRLSGLASSNTGGAKASYNYDAAGRLTSVTDTLVGDVTQYTYDNGDRPVRIDHANGTSVGYSYDADDRVEQYSLRRGANLVAQTGYTFDPVGRVQTVREFSGRTTNYVHDRAGRLLREQISGGAVNGSLDYFLDPAGNRIQRSSSVPGVSDQGFSYNANNGATSFSYDAPGNVVAGLIGDLSLNDIYDFADRLVSRDAEVQYLYDGDGRRVGEKTWDTLRSRWVSRTRLLAQVNPTGLSQEIEEYQDGKRTGRYILGLGRETGDRFFDEVTSGSGLTIALAPDGTVWTWGGSNSTPQKVANLSGVVAVGAGGGHYLALKADGTVWSWGSNDRGQLGVGTTTAASTPTQVVGLTGVVEIATQLNHTLALKSDGTVWGWGDNTYGQLGDGTSVTRTSAIKIATLPSAAGVAVGAVHSYAITTTGTVWSWGDNHYGQLGSGDYAASSVPQAIPNLTNVGSLGTGSFHAVAVRTDGSVWTWGDNSLGQVGVSTVQTQPQPAALDAVGSVSVVVSGARHVLALKADGSVWGWGENRFGQLGFSAPEIVYAPTQVPGLPSIAAIGGGARASYARSADGTWYGWGDNRQGQLAVNANAGASSPKLLGNGATPPYLEIAGGGESGPNPTRQPLGSLVQTFAREGLGSTDAVTNEAGLLSLQYEYNAFGELLSARDRDNGELGGLARIAQRNPYLYRGERLEGEIGAYHLRARDYAPQLGRFQSMDRFAGFLENPLSLNRYIYAEADPVGKSDPSGQFAITSLPAAMMALKMTDDFLNEMASIGPDENYDPVQAMGILSLRLTGNPALDVNITQKERAIWLRSSVEGGMMGVVLDEAGARVGPTDSGQWTTAGSGAGSAVYFTYQAAPRFRTSQVERSVEMTWGALQRLQQHLNTGPHFAQEPRAQLSAKWQSRWSTNIYYDAILQANLRSQLIDGAVEAHFTKTTRGRSYDFARTPLSAETQRLLRAEQGGGMLDWDQAMPAGMTPKFQVLNQAQGSDSLFENLEESNRFQVAAAHVEKLGQGINRAAEMALALNPAFAVTSDVYGTFGGKDLMTGETLSRGGRALSTASLLVDLFGLKVITGPYRAVVSTGSAVIGVTATATRETGLVAEIAAKNLLQDAKAFGRGFPRASHMMGIVPHDPLKVGVEELREVRQASKAVQREATAAEVISKETQAGAAAEKSAASSSAAAEEKQAAGGVPEAAPSSSEGAAGPPTVSGTGEKIPTAEVAAGSAIPQYLTPFRPLSDSEVSVLKEKIANRTITRAEYEHYQWDRRFSNRRARGVARFWAEERKTLKSGNPGTRKWTREQQADILAGRRPKFNGETIEGHHRYNALDHPQLADNPENIYPATIDEHLYRWHGGNFQNDTLGVPLNPSFPDEF